MNETEVFASAPAAAACPPMLKAPRTVFPDGSVSGKGPAGPCSPVAPFGPCGPGGPGAPFGPADNWPFLKSTLSSDPFFTFGEVTAFNWICRGPTLFVGRETAA